MTANDDKKTMDAASALTRLQEDAQEESGGSASAAAEKKNKTETAEDDTASADGKEKKRFLPEHKKPDAAPTFPEKVSIIKRDWTCLLFCWNRTSHLSSSPGGTMVDILLFDFCAGSTFFAHVDSRTISTWKRS